MWEAIESNKRKTLFLVAGMFLLLVALGGVIGEYTMPGGGWLLGAMLAFWLWFFHALFSFYMGDSFFLLASRARKIEKDDHPVYWNVVEEMAIAAGMAKMPALYIIDDRAPNAFAVGRSPDKAAVAVTAGLLEACTRDELQGVVAHELAHIQNRDSLYMIMMGTMLGVIVLIAEIFGRMGFRSRRGSGGGAMLVVYVVLLLFVLLSPLLAQLIYYAVSRRREYLADACSAQYTRYPEGLASALEKISGYGKKLPMANSVTAPMYIVNPLKLTSNKLSDLSSTHPPTSERIRILRSMAGGAGFTAYEDAFRQVTGKPVGVIPRSALAEAAAVAVRAPAEPDPRNHQERVRQATDALWKVNDYIFIPCACDTMLKIPPTYRGQTIDCPHCGKSHEVK